MTNEQLLDMVRMRLDGCTFQNIADKYGITKQHVEQSIKSICGVERNVSIGTLNGIIYPNIRARMCELNWGYSKLAAEICSNCTSVRYVLIGKVKDPKLFIALKIADALNLDVRTAFERSGQDDA